MHQDIYKVKTSPKKIQLIKNYKEPNKEYLSKLSTSPKKKYVSPQYVKKSYFDEGGSQINNYAIRQQRQYNLNCQKDSRLSALIYEAISSADFMVKHILHYQLPQFEGMCSKYLLSKQKLYSYLHSQNIGLISYKSKNSKLSKFKPKIQDLSKEKEQISLKQLKRLENIVYHTFIPLLKQEANKLKKKEMYQKFRKQIEVANPEQRQRFYLLQKLNSKSKKFNLDEYIEVLEKYILKVMEKQNKLVSKVNLLQQKLEAQINKVQEYQNFIKKRQQEKHQDDIERANQLKRMVRYQEFVKSIQSILKQQEEDYFTKQTQNLDHLISRIRKILQQQNDKKEKKCIHRQKSGRQNTDSEYSRTEQQKWQKQAIRNLNKQIGDLKQICQQLQEKLRNKKEEFIRAQNKQKKLTKQNQSLSLTIQRLSEDLSNANKMVQQYLLVVGRFDQEFRKNQDNINQLKQSQQRQEEQRKNSQERNQQLLKHLEEIEQRYKDLEELSEKRDSQNQQLVQNLYSKQIEIKDLFVVISRYEKQIKMLNDALIERQQNILKLQQKVNNSEGLILKQANNMEIQINAQPIAVVIDDIFIDKSQPNHQRGDFIPAHRFIDIPQQMEKQTNHLHSKQINPLILSQLSSQKQNDLKASQINNSLNENKGQLWIQSQRIKVQNEHFIKIQDEKQIKSQIKKQNLEKIERYPQLKQKALIEFHSECQNLQNMNYEELMNRKKKLRQKIILLAKQGSNNPFIEEIDQFNEEIEKVEKILQMNARSILEKFRKLQKLQPENKLAMEEIEYLRSKLESANLKNNFVSNIPSQSQGSDFSLDRQLRQLLKKKSPFIYNNEIVEKYSEFVQQCNKKIEKHQTGVQTQSYLRVQNFDQSKVYRYLPEIKRILSKEEVGNQTKNQQSLIQQLQIFNKNRVYQSLKLQRTQPPINSQEGLFNASLPQNDIQQQQQPVKNTQNMRKARYNLIRKSFKDLSDLMNYHKASYFNLHNIFKKTSSKNIIFNDVPSTPSRKPLLQNQEYLQKITRAPEKHQQSDILRQEDKILQKLQQKLNQSPINRQNVYELMFLQKQEENQKLKQIIEKFTLNQFDKKQMLQNQQKMQYELIQRNKILQKRLAQLEQFNQQLKSSILCLRNQYKKKQVVQKNQEVADFHKLEEQLQNNKLEEPQIKQQPIKQIKQKVCLKQVQIPEHENKKQRVRITSQVDFN